MYIYDENEDDDNDDGDNNHNLIKQKKKTFCRGLTGSQARWSQKAKLPGRYTGATTWNLSGFSTLLVPVFIKTFINSICKILIKVINLQMPSSWSITPPTTTTHPPSSTTRPQSFYQPHTQKTHPIEKSQSQIQKP